MGTSLLNNFIVVGFGLLFGSLFLAKYMKRNEGFVDIYGRCGVDLPTCTAGTKCMNGYCMPTSQPKMPAKTDFIILPAA